MRAPIGRRFLLALPALAYAALILLLSSIPGRQLPETGAFPGGDKALHAVEYLLFGLLLLLPLRDLGWRGRGLVLAIGVPFAAFDEFLQTTVPGRSGTVDDFLVDLAALVLALVVDLGVTAYRRGRAPVRIPGANL